MPDAEAVEGEALDLEAWRRRTLDRVIPVLAVVAAPAAAGGSWLAWTQGPMWIAPFDLSAWLLLVALAGGWGSYRLRGLVVVGLFALVGSVVLVAIGPVGVGHLWLAPAPILAGLFFGRFGLIGWLAVVEAVTFGSMLLPGARHALGGAAGGSPLASYAWWIMVGASLACVALVVGLPTVHLVEGLARSQALLRRARSEARSREEAERTERQRFEHLFAETPAALLLADAAGRIVRVNQRARQLFGVAEGAAAFVADLLDEPSVAAVARVCEDAQGDDAAGDFSGSAVGRSAGGAGLDLELRVVPFEDDGRRAALLGALDVGARVAAERDLARALAEKVTLLQEVHHRVKNNLQIVSSVLELQADRLPEGGPRRALEESTRRVRSMALVHQHLYASDRFDVIDFAAYLQALVGEHQRSLAPDAEFALHLEPLHLSVAQAIPCGLVLNELLTNALKHGRDAEGRCRVRVTLCREGRKARLEVADQGPGLSAPWAQQSRKSLGAQVVSALARQLRATLSVEGPPGARFSLVWDPAGSNAPSRAGHVTAPVESVSPVLAG